MIRRFNDEFLKKEEITCEFGGTARFADMKPVSDGEPVLCKCGKPAGSGIAGLNSYILYCGNLNCLNFS